MSSAADAPRAVGRQYPRLDSREKVTGRARYAADIAVPGLLHARVVPSVYAHARIRRVDASAALDVPGVVAVLTAGDLPIDGWEDQREFEPLARDEVLFAGQPVALVVAETEAAAEDAADLVLVDAEILPPVIDAIAALDIGADLARAVPVPGAAGPGTGTPGGGEDTRSANVVDHRREQSGDVAGAAGRCDVVVEATFRTDWVYQGYLEPQAAIAWVEPDGTLAVTSATQGTFHTRDHLARLFGLPSAKVRVAGATIGGGFGGKLMQIEPLAAAAALRLRRPVRLLLARTEDFKLNSPLQGLTIELRIGARRTGELELLVGRVISDAGAYGEWSFHWLAAETLVGPYRWPAVDIEVLSVRTNRFAAGSYRAPTGPQLTYAVESLIDELAATLELDPVALRAANLAAEGDTSIRGDPRPPTGARACLERISEHRLWRARDTLPRGEGVGLALGVWTAATLPSAATCRLEPDGTLTVITGVVDVSGATTALALIAAETVGLEPSAVTVVTGDTATAPSSPASVGSAITYGTGLAVQRASTEVRDLVLAFASSVLEIGPDDLEITAGVVRPIGAPDRGRPVSWFATRDDGMGGGVARFEGHGRALPGDAAPSAAAHLAHVRVDEETGEVSVLDYVAVQDVGTAIAPALVQGQMAGGAVQAIGVALREALVHDRHGQLVTGSLLDYALPRASGVPAIETVILEVPAPQGPFGARGMAETCVVPGAAAVGNAVASAVGVRMRELPITQARLWAELTRDPAAGDHRSPGA